MAPVTSRIKIRAQYTVYTPSRAMEWLCAGIAAGFSIALALGPLFSTGEHWARFAEIGTEREWAVAIGLVAYIRMAALLVNGHYRRTPAIRAVTALLGAGLSAFIAALFIVPDQPLQTGTFTYGLLAVGDLVSCWRAAKDAAIADWIWGKAMAENPPAPMPWEIHR